ncbi:monovalent cation/H+ antiporter subunit A [Alcanivorax limicola]|uniref:monovalent cation/H+ antiporter subunit A n=1 Tax=Alcanivorax limicola TaxID=2874102 RepID=UPI001CC16691|nr:monovalent cation/H+ antiporter subunit A [Alcanivorax limicola]
MLNILWILLLPLLGACLPLMAARLGRAWCAGLTVMPVLIALALLLGTMPAVLAGQVLQCELPWLGQLGLALALRVDGLSWLFALLILGIGVLVILYAHYYLDKRDSGGRFFALLLLFMGAMLGVVLSDNLLLLVLFWELTSISSFLLIGYWYQDSGARKGARMALAVTGAGGLALLAGMLLLGHIVGSYALGDVLAAGDQIRAHALYPLVLVLVLLGAFTKSAQFPFHFWLPHAMSAPTPVSAYLHSATMVKAGVFLLARFHPALAGTEMWGLLVTGVGLATLLLGAMTAMFRHDLKGLLAFSTISHLGLITLLFGLNTPMATVAALFHIVNHATFKASLFMAAGIIDHETGTRDMRLLGGLRRYLPYTAVLATIAAGAMAGVPLLNGFLSKEMFFAETVQARVFGTWHLLVPIVAVIASGFSVAYSLRFIRDVFFRATPSWLAKKAPHEPARYMRVPVEILVVLCLAVGMLPMFMVGGLLSVAATATLGEPAPAFDLVIWHGFDTALQMSLVALVLGLVIYHFRRRLHAWHERLPLQDIRFVFEAAIQGLGRIGGRVANGVVNGSLQRYMLLLLLMAFLLPASALWAWPHWTGSRALMPVDPVTAVGAFILCASAIGTVMTHHYRLAALVQLSAVGLMVALAFARFSAPDLALTQISVEIVTIVFLMLALYFLPQYAGNRSSRGRLIRDAGIAGIVGAGVAALAWAVMTRPLESISGFFLEQSVPGGGGTNVVNVILVDFRGFDTFGEITVLALAAIGIYSLLDGLRIDAPGRPRGELINPHPMIMTVVSRPMLPIALAVALYIFLRGHNLPGGGFIAGLITAVALILQFVGNGVNWTQERLHMRYHPVLASGLLLALATGVGSWVFGYPFLTSAHTHVHVPLIGDVELATAMLFDLGVYLVVVSATLLIIGKLGSISAVPKSTEASH